MRILAMTRYLFPLIVLLSASACRTVGAGEAKPDNASSTSATDKAAAAPKIKVGTDPGGAGKGTPLSPRPGDELAAFAGGCFWGTEDLFRQVPGVVATAVGYTGGKTVDPTYPQVCTHTTGHAEAVLVEFDPKKVTYDALLGIFFKNHDPTTMNRQGPDVGDQYRSEVFTFSDDQARAVQTAIAREQTQRTRKIVTRVSPIGAFYKAEEYHQQYDEKSGTHSCPIGLPQGT
jgi:peptide-methionine (S)-S-oxide reductase